MTAKRDPLKIVVPTHSLGGGGADMRSRLVTWDWRTKLVGTPELILDFKNTSFIEPWALALFTAYGLRIHADFSIPVTADLDSDNPSNIYISRMGLKHVLESGQSTPDWDKSSQNTGLHVIRTHHDVTRFVQSAGNLGLSTTTDVMDAVEYCMAEIGRNVVQHSYSKIGGVAIAQYFPERRAIQISIADYGKGVFKALKPMYPELRTDLEGLKLSVLPHVSGAFGAGSLSGSDNAGLGLFFSKEICWRSGGSFWLLSGDALLGVNKNDASGSDRIYRKLRRWDGTSVTIDLPQSGIRDFAETLSTCRTLAAQARECSGTAGLDFLSEMPELDDLEVIRVGHFKEDVEAAAKIRDEQLLPHLAKGGLAVLDFGGARFVTQSFVHALLHDVFRVPGSLLRLSFLNCTNSSEEAIRAVAAYAASYDICVDRGKKRRPPTRSG